ncbi:E3 ubiquitin-protein ligase MARCH5-like [Diaphorina citri]|uniref:E3 ubiquitin-protein ligase MARCHF5 n=1 Tax=Diaphorina citri TaxID=121845 RepID=A0A3Q0J6V8_DIACI|nr:E3 ubiquitin-protein ligase MARCH5-like [Diaphorina citri]
MGDLIDQGGSDVSSGDIDNDDDSLSSLHGSDVATPGTLNYDENDLKYCWVCFATHEDDRNALWVQPCLCRGTSKWVHQACLNRWIDEKQKGNAFTQVACPQCNTKYFIVYPYRGLLVSLLDTIDTAVYKLCPFVAAGVVLGSMYWCAVTYGAVTVMVVIGRENGLQVMREVDAIVLLLGLPAIPVVLILGKYANILSKYIFVIGRENGLQVMREVDAIVLLLGLPAIPVVLILGKYGGVTFIVIKGILKIYHKQQKFVMQRRRRVLDFADRPPSTSRTS